MKLLFRNYSVAIRLPQWQIRVKRRYGRLHRLLILSGNEVKARFLKPPFEREFHVQPTSKWLKELLAEGILVEGAESEGGNEGVKDDEGNREGGKRAEGGEGGIRGRMPSGDTVDLTAELDKIKEEVGLFID
jgi:hypothetical protein